MPFTREAHDPALQHSTYIQKLDNAGALSESDMSLELFVTGETAPQDLRMTMELSNCNQLHRKLNRALMPKYPCGTVLYFQLWSTDLLVLVCPLQFCVMQL